MAETVRRRVVVQGLVQGVFFRESLRRLAVERGVAGFARNLPDGTLEAVFEGPDAAVRELIAFARQGPPDARVERLEATEQQPQRRSGFSID